MGTHLFKTSSLWKAFRRAEDGNVAVLFALTLIPVIGLVGAAIDYSRANAIRTNMQAAADSAALAVSKTASSQTSTQIQDAADKYFRALITQPEATITDVTATYTKSSVSNVVVDASATMKTRFMGVLGISQMTLKVSATTAWGNTRLRVALALDNTGSMSSSGKMTALKTAAKNLIDQLKAAATNNGDVYISIIPFSKDVNIGGSSNYTQNWVKWDDWDVANGTCSKSSYTTKSSCTSNKGTWTAKNHNTWNGCLMDRDQNYDISNSAPEIGTSATLFPAEQYSYCPVELMPLSYDWTSLKSKVDAMTPDGNTNVTIGLVWGWHSLTQGSPLAAPSEDANYQYQKVIILLTDGENTQNRFSTSQTSIDARTKAACTAAKNAGITIYTILVMQGTQSLLQSCASSTSNYFYLTSANQIITTFDTIGTQLTRLRVAK
ncbi:vWA domain-containing protein [Rhodoplanes roseus]|uniref:Pilus assembly protein TadG n=1 Tax=Rhodoplanes roseus TaxID=29409 RepID=A0A327KVP0_9BRAD|nr:pilus assembly protein [Rhodoplanes roseus]RAI42889.1 pilus assembly protein TadG [Rhodoplanes roseus]